jgi:hypothetical protein
MMQQTKKIVRTLTLQRPDLPTEVTEEAAMAFGEKELAGHAAVHLGVVLRGDIKQVVPSFCESEGIDLLVIGSRSGGRLRKTLAGGSVSNSLISHAPCPCVVVPYRAMGLASMDEEDGGALSPRGVGSSEPSTADEAWAKGAEAELRDAVEERERTIAELRDRVRALELELAAARGAAAAAALARASPKRSP